MTQSRFRHICDVFPATSFVTSFLVTSLVLLFRTATVTSQSVTTERGQISPFGTGAGQAGCAGGQSYTQTCNFGTMVMSHDTAISQLTRVLSDLRSTVLKQSQTISDLRQQVLLAGGGGPLPPPGGNVQSCCASCCSPGGVPSSSGPVSTTVTTPSTTQPPPPIPTAPCLSPPIIIQHHSNGSAYFDLTWSQLVTKQGTPIPRLEFWHGLDDISVDTNLGRAYKLRIDMTSVNGTAYWAEYTTFVVAGASDQYRLTVAGFTGNIDDAFSSHSGSVFSAKDRDNDLRGTSSAILFGGGWWYTRSSSAILNGSPSRNFFWTTASGLIYLQSSTMTLSCPPRVTVPPQTGIPDFLLPLATSRSGNMPPSVTTTPPSTIPPTAAPIPFPDPCPAPPILIQRHYNASLFFNLNWSQMALRQVAAPPLLDLWYGLEPMHQVTNAGRNYKLRIDMVSVNGTSYWAEYSTFSVAADNQNYMLTVDGFNGNIDDSFTHHNGSFFTTKDRDNDRRLGNTAVYFGGGWWYTTSFEAGLNSAPSFQFAWNTTSGWVYLQSSTMRLMCPDNPTPTNASNGAPVTTRVFNLPTVVIQTTQTTTLATTVSTPFPDPCPTSPILIQRHVNGSAFFNLTWSQMMVRQVAPRPLLDFWYGIDGLSRLTNVGRKYKLRIDMLSNTGVAYWAEYTTFSIAPESQNYRLTVGGFSGNIDDSFTHHNGSFFTTKDRDNDHGLGNNAILFGGAWWYTTSFEAGLNCAPIYQYAWNTTTGWVYLQFNTMRLICP